MPDLDDELEFVVKSDQLRYTTQTNGDVLVISGINFNSEQAGILAWLTNEQCNLEIEVKKKCSYANT